MSENCPSQAQRPRPCPAQTSGNASVVGRPRKVSEAIAAAPSAPPAAQSRISSSYWASDACPLSQARRAARHPRGAASTSPSPIGERERLAASRTHRLQVGLDQLTAGLAHGNLVRRRDEVAYVTVVDRRGDQRPCRVDRAPVSPVAAGRRARERSTRRLRIGTPSSASRTRWTSPIGRLPSARTTRCHGTPSCVVESTWPTSRGASGAMSP